MLPRLLKRMRTWFGTNREEETSEKIMRGAVESPQANHTVKAIREYILLNFPPLTWERLGLLLYKDFQRHRLSFPTLEDQVELPEDLVKRIDQTLRELYNKGLRL